MKTAIRRFFINGKNNKPREAAKFGRKEDKMIKTKEFKFRLTEKEFEEMRKLAEQEGRTMSNLIRYLVAKEREEREK